MTLSRVYFLCALAASMAVAGQGMCAEEGEAQPLAPAALTGNSALKVPAEAASIQKLESRLAAALAEAEHFREESERLRLHAEALGLAAISPEIRVLQERLISAANDLRLVEREKITLEERLVSLSEAALASLSESGSEENRNRLRSELALANRDLLTAKNAAQPPPPAIEAAKVVSQKADLGLVVIDAGRASGLRPGTPMKIIRNEKTIASGLVVDVRNRISGLLITSGDGHDAIKTGDSVKPETTPPSKQ